MTNFWQKLAKPFFVLAPMDDVTDTVFRQMTLKTARPEVLFTEFTAVEGMQSVGRKATLTRLKFDPSEHPVVAQIWGLDPEKYFQSAQDIKKMGFDGIDINMGCPVADVVKRGACAGLIANPELVRKIVESVKKGSGGLPVSVKTRIGLKKIVTEEWISFLLSLDIDALTVHARTAAEMSAVPAHWEEIAKVVELRNKINPKTIIIGNGDVQNRQDGEHKAQQYGCDGIMIGRGIFKNPWAFEKNPQPKKIAENLKLLLIHAQLFDRTWGNTKNFLALRKFFKAYVHGFEGASDLRTKLMETTCLEDVENVINQFGPNFH